LDVSIKLHKTPFVRNSRCGKDISGEENFSLINEDILLRFSRNPCKGDYQKSRFNRNLPLDDQWQKTWCTVASTKP
jgi:hypothetical protein